MAQTMKEIIGEAFANVTESRLCEFLPVIVKTSEGTDFLTKDPELSTMIRKCLDKSADDGMIGILLPENGILKPFIINNRGGILGTESLEGSLGLFGGRAKKTIQTALVSIQGAAQASYNDLLKQSENDRNQAKEAEKAAKEAKKREFEAKRLQEEKEKFQATTIKEGEDAFRSLRTGRVFRPEMPEMIKKVMMGQAASSGELDNMTVDEFTAKYVNDDKNLVYTRTAEILDNEIAKRSQMALDALESMDSLWDFVTGYEEYLSSKKMSFRDKLIGHGESAFSELFGMSANDETQMWKIPELLKQIYLANLAADESNSENDIEDCKAEPAFDKAIDLVSNITTMNIRLGTLNPDADTARKEIIRQIDAARKQMEGRF